MRFELGQQTATQGIVNAVSESEEFSKEVVTAFRRYISGDWGDIYPEDKELNENAIKYGGSRIFASYKTSKGKIYIITEWDRSYTTFLFADEY